MSAGFTKKYYFEFKDGRVKLANLESPEELSEEDTEELDLVKNWDTGARQAILKELFELTDEATGANIVNAELRLQQLPKIKMNPKKMESLQKKYITISTDMRGNLVPVARLEYFMALKSYTHSGQA